MNEKFKFIPVPYEEMEELMTKINSIYERVCNNESDKNGTLGEYITEREAKAILSKGTTWFWNKRQTGELVGRKAGNTWYYKRSEIIKFIEHGKSE